MNTLYPREIEIPGPKLCIETPGQTTKIIRFIDGYIKNWNGEIISIIRNPTPIQVEALKKRYGDRFHPPQVQKIQIPPDFTNSETSDLGFR